jgi:hypothetical protein
VWARNNIFKPDGSFSFFLPELLPALLPTLLPSLMVLVFRGSEDLDGFSEDLDGFSEGLDGLAVVLVLLVLADLEVLTLASDFAR